MLRDHLIFSLLARRVIAIDLGSSHLKLVLAEKSLGRIRLQRWHMVDLQQEGLLTIEEVDRHLQELVREWGDYPVALAIPQHLALSNVIDLPGGKPAEIRQRIESEARNLSGLSESAIIYDYRALPPFGRFQNPFGVTLSRESEIQGQLQRIYPDADLAPCEEITTPASALVTAWLRGRKPDEPVVLVDLGATCTVVAAVVQGRGVLATSYPIGSESFSSAIASLRKASFEEAEVIKRTADLFEGPDALPGFWSVVDIWLQDLEKCLRDWMEDVQELRPKNKPFAVRISGGGLEQPGLLEYLRRQPRFSFEPWPAEPVEGQERMPWGRLAVAWGLALQGLERSASQPTLLPPRLQAHKRRQQQLATLTWAGWMLVALVLACLLGGTIYKLALGHWIGRQVENTEAALRKSQAVELLLQQQEIEYSRMLPVIERHKRTVDTLSTLAALQKVRQGKDLWLVTLADSSSYFRGAAVAPFTTNSPDRPHEGPATNQTASAGDFVVELNIAASAGDRQGALKSLVAELKQTPLFRNVDTLPASQRSTNAADPRLYLAERNFALFIDLTDLELPRPLVRAAPSKPPSPAAPARAPP
ncbi:MAG: pilus assembly protein PilM [Verrucomicrobia bacterium]|nr:pilus assembly protein PilM [Verrucomicrobiota bacterium]